MIKCLKGYKSLGSLCNVKIKKSLSESVSESVTRSPIELFWTAKNRFNEILDRFMETFVAPRMVVVEGEVVEVIIPDQ